MHGNEAAEEAGNSYKISGILNNFCLAQTNCLTPFFAQDSYRLEKGH